MINTRRTVQDILQEEVLRERAAVLARAGEKLAEALERLHKIAADLDAGLAALRGVRGEGAGPRRDTERGRMLREINAMIRSYNRQRNEAGTCYYELIVTREAMGLVHHERLAEIYRLPPKKRCLPER
jgi:hypothetical protein